MLLQIQYHSNFGASVSSGIVNFYQLVGIEGGGFEKLDLSDRNIAQRIDSLALFLDAFGDRIRDEFHDKPLEVNRGGFASHDLNHLLSDGLHPRGLGVAGLLNFGDLFCEGEGKEAEDISILGLHVHKSLDEGPPFSYERAELIGGVVHSMEICEAILPMDVINPQFEVTEVRAFVSRQIGEIDFYDSPFKGFGSDVGPL